MAVFALVLVLIIVIAIETWQRGGKGAWPTNAAAEHTPETDYEHDYDYER